MFKFHFVDTIEWIVYLRQFAVVVLHAMTFVDDHVLPRQFGERRFIFDDVLVSGEEDVELDGPHLVLDDAADRRRSLVADDIDRRGPFLKFQRPVGQSRQGHDDQIRSRVLLDFHQVSDQTDCLDRFAQTHFVGQNSVQVVVVKRHEPLQTFDLILCKRQQRGNQVKFSFLSFNSFH